MSDQNQADLEQIEICIEDAKEYIENGERLERLLGNQDFKDLIENGYLKDFAVETVKKKAHPGMASQEAQLMLENQLVGISQLNMFLLRTGQQADTMRKTLAEHEATREEILKEEATA